MADTEAVAGTEAIPPTQNEQHDSAAKKKQANSYYYWHNHEKERAKVGDVAPMPKPVLLKKSDPSVLPASTASYPITKHSWCDGKKNVTVYIDTKLDEKETMVEDTLQVEFGKRRLTVSYIANVQTSKDVATQRRKQLVLCLAKAIKSKESSYKVKDPSGQIVIRLAKAEETSWWELAKKDGKLSDADDSDEENDGKADEGDGAAEEKA